MTYKQDISQHVCPGAASSFAEWGKDAIEQSICSRFEQQVRQHGACLAVRTKTHQLTYADLNGQANLIATEILAARGAGPEPVALLFDQGAALIAAILAVLKTGKAYVALDPTYPSTRLAAMLDDAGATLLVADDASMPTATALTSGRRTVLRVGLQSDAAPDHGVGNPAVNVSPDAVAYIFHTSGSTGRPKGVYDTHRNVLHNILRYTNALRIAPSDRHTLLQSCSFSGSVSSLFCALLNGAATFPFDVRKEGPRRLGEWLREERVTVYHSVPTIFRSFLSGDVRFPDLRCIRLEGDRSSRVDVDLFRRHFEPQCRLVIGLGATETGISRQYFIDHETEVDDGILPIGYPVRDVEVSVLDEEGDEVETGQVGEIAVRSAYLAAGYWRRPDLTQAAFRPDARGGQLRVYRTGDMGRLRADGCLEYLGRKDFVLKVRGNRIEPAEIETALLSLPQVAEAVATTFEGDGDEVQLVAYLVPSPNAALSPTVLRRTLAETLPSFMIPSTFVTLDALPLDVNGKLDRRALQPPVGPARLAGEGNDPRGPLEERIARLFQIVLGLERVRIDESFFDLGGDSLAATEICAQLAAETGMELPLSTLVRAPTVEALARLLGSSDAACLVSPLVPIQAQGSKPPLFLVGDRRGRVLGYTALVRHLGTDQPVWGLQSMTGADEIPAQAARYVAEVRRMQPSGPYRLGGLCFGGVVAFEMAHQLHERGENVEFLALIGISAFDFPRLVSPAAWRRDQRAYGGDGFFARVRNHVARACAMRPDEASRYLLRKGLKVAPYLRNRFTSRAAGIIGRGPGDGWNGGDVDRANQRAFARYTARPFPGRVALFLSQDETAIYTSDPSSDWRGLATAGIDVYEVPGDHNAMLAEPRVRELARLVTESLERARPLNAPK
jgi:amino acid adenylation domain-containing protein